MEGVALKCVESHVEIQVMEIFHGMEIPWMFKLNIIHYQIVQPLVE